MADQMSPEGYTIFDNEKCTSLSEINPGEVDWKGASTEACINEFATDKEVEVLSSDDDHDKNVVANGSETIEPMASYSEALALLDKLAYDDGMSDNIDILFLLREKIKKLSIQTKKQSSFKDLFL